MFTNLPKFEKIDMSGMRRYDETGSKIQTEKTYTQDEYNLIMKYNLP